MARPDVYPHPVDFVEQRETHISKVFLTDRFVYKIKKAVNLEFLDYTTLEKRKHFCVEEMKLNRRLSENVYLDVVPITYRSGRYFINGPGEPVEYAVKMRRLLSRASLKYILRNKAVTSGMIDQLAKKLAAFYNNSPTNDHISKHGQWESVRSNCAENFEQTRAFAGDLIDSEQYQIIKSISLAFIKHKENLFQHRIESGYIRDCHGDLRCGHVYYQDGIQIIDCIEFNDRFRFADVISDLAFIAMDIDMEGFPAVAHRLILACARFMNAPDLFALLDFYKCYRAFVRAKVHCMEIAEYPHNDLKKEQLRRKISRFISLSYQYALRFSRPTLWVLCGMPASGKSTIAKEISRSQNIRVLHSDEIRKQVFGLKPVNSHVVDFGKGIYSERATALTYGKMLLLAQEELKSRRSVILDGTFQKKAQRKEVLRLAQDYDIKILFIECQASKQTLNMRLKDREEKISVSDARIRHLSYFIKKFEPFDDVDSEMHLVVHTDCPLVDTLHKIYAYEYYPD